MLGSHNHIPIFKSKGIRVPDILAEDYSKISIPFAYQALTKIEGRDIVDVIAAAFFAKGVARSLGPFKNVY